MTGPEVIHETLRDLTWEWAERMLPGCGVAWDAEFERGDPPVVRLRIERRTLVSAAVSAAQPLSPPVLLEQFLWADEEPPGAGALGHWTVRHWSYNPVPNGDAGSWTEWPAVPLMNRPRGRRRV
jgi:hypothetical protein